MKKFFLSILSITVLGLSTSCSGDDDNTNPDPDPDPIETGVRSGFLTEDETWTNDIIWTLDGKVYVPDGVTLTIEQGTIIKGTESSGSNASALIVAQGGVLLAEGTPNQPIIFTSVLDNIQVGQTAGTNLSVNERGLWGGLLVLGKARGSFSGDAVSIQIEGIPANEPGQYGGTDDNDFSGRLRYISVRHGGAVIGSDNEINGITLGGVGSSTVVENIEIVANDDDGLEIFGGMVNVTNVLVWGCQDDQLDLDEAWGGTITNAVSIQTNESDHHIEYDGPAGSFQRGGTINGLTLIGDNSPVIEGVSGGREYADFRDGAIATIKNVYAFGSRPGSDVEIDDADTAANYNNGTLVFENWQVVFPAGDSNATMWNDTTGAAPTFPIDADTWSTGIQAGQQNTGANLSVFSWTFAAQKNAF